MIALLPRLLSIVTRELADKSVFVPVLPNPSGISAPKEAPRGTKRSRSPEQLENIPLSGGPDDGESTDDQKPRKRGRPPKSRTSGGGPESPTSTTSPSATQSGPIQAQTPQNQTQPLPPQAGAAPSQASPPKATPTKTVVKALPTVRDHTTDQLNPEGDEYIPRERDDAGEKKVSPNGHPLGGREYKCRTFVVPHRGDKLFMLATECARVLGYRDSYLLFNKNRSLYKIIATQPEKDDLINQDILPYSYRSRQIAIVTAKSMFRQFGSRVITHGRRVRDDYWEAKARKQGFTEEDLAGEKRPGAAKARDAAAAEAVNIGAAGLGHQDIIYSNGPLDHQGHGLHPVIPGNMPASIAPLPMIHLAPTAEDLRLRDYGHIPRPRQEITGAPYQDRTQPSASAEIMNQATHTADMNKVINQQRKIRHRGLEEHWTQKREVPVSTPQQQPGDTSSGESQTMQSPHLAAGNIMGSGQQPSYSTQPSQMMSPTYSQQPHPGSSLAQSPARPSAMRSDQMHPRSSGLPYGSSATGQGSPYGYPQSSSHMWGQPPPQPHQSPLPTHSGMPQYSPSSQQHASHPSPSPHQPPQLHHSGSSSSVHGNVGSMGYPGLGGVGPANYPTMGQRSLYQQPNQSSQQYMQQTTAGQQAGMQGWAPPPQSTQHQGQGWPGY
ncbi:MAG: hypothetical protein LQ342_001720 [Letrouitia transgressa]|nr:MAG: hypothetical protein LQ342_001720 [Letrouitia transgressa]